MPLSHTWEVLAGAPLSSGWSCPTNDLCVRVDELTFNGIMLKYISLCLWVHTLKDTLASGPLHFQFCSTSQTWPLRTSPLLMTF